MAQSLAICALKMFKFEFEREPSVSVFEWNSILNKFYFVYLFIAW